MPEHCHECDNAPRLNGRIALLLCLLALPLSAAVPSADLSIRMNTAATSARPNSIFNYRLMIQSNGPSEATNVVVTDVLPADLLFESIVPGFFTCTTPPAGTNGTVTCSAATYPALTTGISLQVSVAPGAKPGVVTNRATITSSTFDPDDDDATAVAELVRIVAPAGVERRLDPVASPPWMSQFAPQVATTRVNALAVWGEEYVSFAPPDSNVSIRGALFRPDVEGQTLITFAAPEFGTSFAYPVVAAASDRYLVVWRESKSSQGRILARRLRTDGSFIDAQPLVLDVGNAAGCCTDVGDPRPSVASNGRDFYVAWVSGNYDVRGIAVPSEGPVLGQSWLLSRESDTRSRGHHDVEVVWTSAKYIVVWLDRVFQLEPPMQEPLVLRYARVTAEGVLFDTGLSKTIAGPPVSSITATSHGDGAVVTIDYAESSSSQWCMGVLPFTASGEPGTARVLRCDDAPISWGSALHPGVIPGARGFLLVQPGRRYPPPFDNLPIRTSSADHALTELADATLLGVVGREVSVATWQGAALLVYNRTDGNVPGAIVPRVFSFLIQSDSRVRAVRH